MSERQIISLPGIPHNAPLPTGAKIGNIVRSSAISGRDPASNDFSDDPERQAAVLFGNVRAFMEKAGGTPANILHVMIYTKELRYNEALDKEWVAMFPDANNRPARETTVKTEGMYGGRFFEIALMAVL